MSSKCTIVMTFLMYGSEGVKNLLFMEKILWCIVIWSGFDIRWRPEEMKEITEISGVFWGTTECYWEYKIGIAYIGEK